MQLSKSVGAVLLGAVLLAPAARGVEPEFSPELEILESVELTEELSYAYEVRWHDEESLALAAGRRGALVVALESLGSGLAMEETRKVPVDDPALPIRALAISPEYFAVTDQNWGFGWMARGGKRVDNIHHHGFVMSFDIHGSRMALLGQQLDPTARQVEEPGQIGWLGSLADGTLKPVLFADVDPDDNNMGRCGWLALGMVRFLADGSFLMIPAVEPSVTWLDEEGRVQRVWSSEEIGIATGCLPSEKERDRTHLDVEFRYSGFLNRIAWVDEILPMGSDAGLVIRRVEGGETVWRLLRLRRDGTKEDLGELVRWPSPYGKLSADLLGDRAAFLVRDDILSAADGPPPGSVQLRVTTFPPAAP